MRLNLDEVTVTPNDVKKALARVPDFGYSGELPLFDTWSLGPTIEHRESDVLDRSNAKALREYLATLPELTDDWEITDCNHWAVGWVKHLSYRVVDADGKPSRMAGIVKAWFAALRDYPIADENLYSEMEDEEAQEVWTRCYSDADRLTFIREHRHEFEFRSFADLLGCVRGKYYAGYASTLLS
jgi:hypothetical protein